jgi:hypothetical protein
MGEIEGFGLKYGIYGTGVEGFWVGVRFYWKNYENDDIIIIINIDLVICWRIR